MEEDKEILQKKIVYDFFIDENPDVQERVAHSRAEGMQQLILVAIKDRFPALADQAQPRIEQMRDTDALETLFRQLISATTEDEAGKLLHL